MRECVGKTDRFPKNKILKLWVSRCGGQYLLLTMGLGSSASRPSDQIQAFCSNAGRFFICNHSLIGKALSRGGVIGSNPVDCANADDAGK